MNFNCSWNEITYQEFLKYLDTIKDLKFQEFQKKIVLSEEVIGIKTNELKKIAKDISKYDYDSFMKVNNSSLYETIMIEGFIIGNLKFSIKELAPYIDRYLEKVNTWAHVDSFAASLKQFKKQEKEGFAYAKKLIHSKNTFYKRCGVILLLDYYLHDVYIDKVLEIVSKIKTDDYYVQMGISWLMSVAYIKYKEKTLVYLVNLKDDFIYNKTLTKIVESRRISDEEKKFIKSLKREKEKMVKNK